MPTVLKSEATLTDRYQTTVPEPVRRALGLNKRDKIRYSIRSNGEVVLTRVEPLDEQDPVLDAFLSFLAQDFEAHPERISSIDATLVARLRSLTAGVELDLELPLLADDE